MNILKYNLYPNSEKIFPFEKADYRREWMDQYPHSFAYRCLPLKIANEAGWLVRSPVDFEVTYITDDHPLKSVKIDIADKDSMYRNYILSHFGRGVITFSLPFILRTEAPWCVWARGYPNYYKNNISFLEGIIETHWLHSTFTYNIRVIEKNQTVSFKKNEPLMFLTCININEINNSYITDKIIDENLELKNAYNTWNQSRAEFNKKLNNPDDWQKDYFKGIQSDGSTNKDHLTKINLHSKEII
jgi:hypothetical protein